MNVFSFLKTKDGDQPQKGSVGGAAVMTMEIDEMIARGYGRSLSIGDGLVTGIVGGGAATTPLNAQPEWVVAVPAGFTIRPFRISHTIKGNLLAADNDYISSYIAVDSKGMWAEDGTYVKKMAVGLRTGINVGSACKIGTAFTGNMTTVQPGITGAAPVNDIELDRVHDFGDVQGTAASVWRQQLKLLYEPKYAPFLVGPCTMHGHWGGTVACSGFASIQWVEGPNELFFRA